MPDAFGGRCQDSLRVIDTSLHGVVGADRNVGLRSGQRPVVADVALLDLQFLAAHPVLGLGAVFADTEDQDAVVADRRQARLPTLLAPALFRLQVEVVVGFQRGERTEDLAGDVQDSLAMNLTGREDLERVIVETQHWVVLRLGAADVTREVVGAMDRPEPLLPLRELRVEERTEGRLLRDGGGGEA